jgi:hypothetical protein
MDTPTASQPFEMTEPIPGYRVQERIGAGGYGEVWKADAPGGIAKAIKVIYGFHDDERATRELNALNRIKQVRHPFILSLERIELVDGRLVIVTELATSSLKNLFEQHRQAGQPGIPRGELLTLLGDAADALDYISQVHTLQHLDIKPENLLLVGGRTKVADFGLVKDLQDVNCSMVGGLTPVYAAPELFDGRPNVHSDQYSLAIVYQEMLTGVLPYEGRTMAQLAAQHLHSRPHLDSLPFADQETIARALSKDPSQRFPSCRDMINSLAESTKNAVRTDRAATSGGYHAPLPTPVETELLSRESIREAAAAAGAPLSSMTQATEPAPKVRDLPRLELGPEDAAYRPTIFVGAGGLAAQTLQTLHRHLVNRFGPLSAVPALQFLLFETDAESLKTVTEADLQTPLGNDSAILLPLRQPADYRRESGNHLHWLSRRWIYNIPRSAQTQSFRPLGRLAFVDHLDRVLDRLTQAIKAAVDQEASATSARGTGLPFREGSPRVFVVSSISGGTGSGMVIDLAYAVRKVLRDLGLSDEGVCGILAHCTGHNPQGRDLAVANAYAFLTELHHYSDSHNAYPGDPTRGLPSFATQDAPFSQAYVVDLGEDLEPDGFAAGADKLAKYLYCNTVTAAGAFFDKCRSGPPSDEPSATADPGLRTFGLAQLGFSYEDIPPTAVDELCLALVTRWRGVDDGTSDHMPASLADPTALLANRSTSGVSQEEIQTKVAARMKALGLDVQSIVAQLFTTTTREMGDAPESYLLTVLADLVNNYKSTRGCLNPMSLGETILDALDTLIRFQNIQDTQRVCLESVLETHLKEIAAKQAAALRDWILSLVNSPKYRLVGAQQAADCVTEHLRALSREAGESIKTVLQQLSSLKQTLLSDKNGGRGWLQWRGFAWNRRVVADRRLCQYFRLRIEELTLNGVCRLTGFMLGQVSALGDQLRNMSADLNRMAKEFGPQPTVGAASQPAEALEMVRAVAEAIDPHKVELVAEMERDVEPELRRMATTDGNNVSSVLSPLLRRTARSLLHRLLKRVTMREIAASSKDKPLRPMFSVHAGLQAAKPSLPECGGARRLLLLTPNDSPSAELMKRISDEVPTPPTVVADKENEMLLCYEMEQLPLGRVAAAVLDQRFQNVEVASRLHTRIDVRWSAL